ncbi:hypothetical protein HW555_008841 [Spodoptera exigua]|uniref:Uncharacterized protein n=1 Tax=Spodoptera exigua TaxID=7107 RepID=A0A835GDM7_SPOEX|nr:hypothetical protein HW555_008841 [Spodoptera exigua]
MAQPDNFEGYIVQPDPVPSESSTTPQPTPISDSIGLQSSPLQDFSGVSEPDVSDNNIVTQDVNTSTDNIAGLQTHQDVSADLNPHNIRKNNKQLQKFVATFDQFINPFGLEVPKDQLINISSGKSASPPVEEFLLNYFTPSIKNYEHSQRFESAQLEYTITGPEQVRPSDFVKELKNSNFKEALVDFFISHWASDEMAPFIGGKIIHINFRKCHSFMVNETNKAISSITEELSCPEHEEADTKIVYHACKINYEANIIIRTIDTDVAAIMLGHMHRLNDESQVWMLTGTGNNLSFICYLYNVENINDVDAARLQIFIDSYTVSDVNEAFNRKKLRNFDASSLPPCKSELLQQFLRANYICCIWNNAHLKNPTTYEPVNNGWILENDEYLFKWFEGDQLPNYVKAGEEDDVDNDEFREWSSSDDENENVNINDDNEEDF